MHTSILSLALAFAPAVLAATPSNYGGWNISIGDDNFEYGYRATHFDVFYIDANTAGAEPIAAGCQTIKRPGVAPADRGCAPTGFNYTLDGDVGVAGTYPFSLEQTVTLDGTEITLYGAGLVEIQCTPHPDNDLPYTQCTGSATARVDKAGDQIIE
ncbi:hypothetical protein ACET3X_008194 [Alternaria dauci]|uniref:AA1-like domain-containing protein n=1 Tax=Alternaria dauci TaxID=48095 RepID=A0ABR3UAK3_9PLEO